MREPDDGVVRPLRPRHDGNAGPLRPRTPAKPPGQTQPPVTRPPQPPARDGGQIVPLRPPGQPIRAPGQPTEPVDGYRIDGERFPGEPEDDFARPNNVTETLVASPVLPNAFRMPPSVPAPAMIAEPATASWSADEAVTELYIGHYQGLVRLAAFLVRDTQTAEEVVQDAFIAMRDGWQRLRDGEKALAYLRQAVVNKARSVLRHRNVVDRNMQKAPPDMPSAEHGALVLLERSAVVSALRELPERQREAIVLRYYADLSEAEIADTMRISRGAVKSHTARGMAALRSALEQE